jgi:hypothetical protein
MLSGSLLQLPLLEVQPGYWQRVGTLRAKVLARGFKSRVADALIAQCCIDHGVKLITRDRDFRHPLPASSRCASHRSHPGPDRPVPTKGARVPKNRPPLPPRGLVATAQLARRAQ